MRSSAGLDCPVKREALNELERLVRATYIPTTKQQLEYIPLTPAYSWILLRHYLALICQVLLGAMPCILAQLVMLPRLPNMEHGSDMPRE